MKKRSRIFVLIAALAALTAAAAAVRLAVWEGVSEGVLRIESSGTTTDVVFSELELGEVKGTVINGKGEEKSVDARGVSLSGLLDQCQITGFAEVTVEADDAYSAAVAAEEIAVPEKVYLIAQEDGGVKMVVFGDSNSKRSVSNVVCLKVR